MKRLYMSRYTKSSEKRALCRSRPIPRIPILFPQLYSFALRSFSSTLFHVLSGLKSFMA
jgi:hypothetical protein